MDIKLVGKLLSEFVSGLVILDDKEEIIWGSKIVKKISGIENVINRKFSDVFPVSLEHIFQKPQIITTLLGQKYRINARRVLDEERLVILVIIDEITDLNEKESRLYCLEKIIESLDEGILMSDYEGRLVLYNQAQENMEGLNSNEIVGKYLWEAYNYNSELSEHMQVFKSGKPILNKYKAYSYKDGIPRYVSYYTQPIVKDGEVIAVYTVSTNETSLQSLLGETIELKRQLFSKNKLENNQLKPNGTSYTFSDIVGESQAMKNLIKEAQTISLLDSTVLIIGETGTGKEVLAQSIHNYKKNQDQPFIAINCAAIPENLLESILFGTVKGAYTGALDQVGLFEEARKGTLFLDEINSLAPSLQSKLLRVLQEKTVRRVGGQGVNPVHCRVICASNEDPHKLISEGKLRQDLFYRIAGICLYLPSLRERPDDIMCLAEFFVNKYNHLLNKQIKSFSPELENMLSSYRWPGNIRELEHVIENLMIKADNNQTQLDSSNMPNYLRKIIMGSNAQKTIKTGNISLSKILRDVESKIITESLHKNEWNLTETAKDLGIIRQSLYYRINKLDIKKPKDYENPNKIDNCN